MSNRRQRRLDHLKTQKGKIDKGYPKKEEARQGHSVTKFIEGKGLYEFTYYNNQWYSKKLDTVNQADSTFSSEVRTNNLVVEPGGSVNMKGAQSIKGIKAEDIQNTPLAGTVTPNYIGQIGALKFSLPATEPGQIGFNNESQEFELKRSEDDKLVYDGTNLKSVRNVNDGNPTFQLGASDTECFKIETTYTSGGKSLSNVVINTLTDGTDADLGKITFKIDEVRHTILEDSGLRLYGKTFSINDSADIGDIFKIETTTHGATTMSTVDDDAEAAHLALDADGDVILDSATAGISTGGIKVKSSGTEIARMNHHHSKTYFHIYENGGASTDDYLLFTVGASGASTIATIDASGSSANLTLDADGVVGIDSASGQIGFAFNGTTVGAWLGSSLFFAEASGAGGDIATYGQIWVKNDTPNNLYFTDDTGQDVQITNNGSLAVSGGTSRFHFVTGGYVLNRTSTTTYYFQFRPLGESWSNTESSPTSINVYDAPAALWVAPAAGKITNLTVQGYVNDTGAADPFKFYIFKGSSTHNATSTSLTSFLTTSQITASAALRNIRHSEDFTSSNTFSAGDTFYVMFKKDSNTGSQDIYFSMTVSGEYT